MKNILLIIVSLIIINSCSIFNKKEASKSTPTKTTSTEMITPKIDDIVNKTWIWKETNLNDGSKFKPKADESTIVFKKDKEQLIITSDCNNGSAFYKLQGKKMEISPIMSTKKMCVNSSEKKYFKHLMAANSVFMKDGKLFIELKMDTGSMMFEYKNK